MNPGAAEVCGDGLDQDCDGTPNGCGPSGDLTLPGDDASIDGEGDFGTVLGRAGRERAGRGAGQAGRRGRAHAPPRRVPATPMRACAPGGRLR